MIIVDLTAQQSGLFGACLAAAIGARTSASTARGRQRLKRGVHGTPRPNRSGPGAPRLRGSFRSHPRSGQTSAFVEAGPGEKAGDVLASDALLSHDDCSLHGLSSSLKEF